MNYAKDSTSVTNCKTGFSTGLYNSEVIPVRLVGVFTSVKLVLYRIEVIILSPLG